VLRTFDMADGSKDNCSNTTRWVKCPLPGGKVRCKVELRAKFAKFEVAASEVVGRTFEQLFGFEDQIRAIFGSKALGEASNSSCP
jgi:hypothetical protein